MAIRPSFSAPGSDNVLSSHPAAYDWRALSNQTGQMAYNASKSSIDAARKQALGAAAGMSPEQFTEQQRGKIRDLTEGRAGELASDPRMNQAMDFFGQVLNGSKLPFSEETQRAQLNQSANGTAAANAAQLRALEEAIVARGGSLQDPSFLAQKQEMMSNRQGQNLDALGRMMAQAGTANFNAQAQGANSLAGIRSGQNNQINQMNLAGAGFEHGFTQNTNNGDFNNGAGGGSTFTTSILGGGGSAAPAFNPTGAFSPSYSGPSNASTGLAGRPAQVHTADSTYAPAPNPSRSTGTGMGYAQNDQNGTQFYSGGATGPFWPGQTPAPVAPKPASFGSPFLRPLGSGQI